MATSHFFIEMLDRYNSRPDLKAEPGHRGTVRSVPDGQRSWVETGIYQGRISQAGSINAYADRENGFPGEPVDCQPPGTTACHSTARIEKLVDLSTRRALRVLKSTLPILPHR